jgi:hypothetical protein
MSPVFAMRSHEAHGSTLTASAGPAIADGGQKGLRPLLSHDAEIVLGVLIVVLGLDYVAGRTFRDGRPEQVCCLHALADDQLEVRPFPGRLAEVARKPGTAEVARSGIGS